MEEKICSKCNELKSLNALSRRSKNGKPKKYCKKCAVVMDVQYRQRMAEEQPEKYKAYMERKKQTSQLGPSRIARYKEYKRRYYLKNRYRHLKSSREANQAVTEEVYTALLQQQNGVCAICRNPETAKDQKGRVRALAIDHNHRSGRLRGLLCFRCNTNLAFIEDTEYMAASFSYLPMNLDTAFNVIQNALQREREVGRANSLTDVAESQRRRETIDQHWQAIQTELAQIEQRIRDLPPLPPHEHIAWAQAVLAMQNLAFLELDTTGLEATDEIIRFTLIDSNLNTIEDFLIKPVGKRLSDKASFVNGIKSEQLEREGLTIQEAWQRVQAALTGRYIISYSQPWDLQQLNATAKRYQLEPVTVIGDDLQRHSTLYYHREYSLTLARICERIGHPLPEHPHQTSLDRAKGQVHFMTAMANAVTDVRPAKTHKSHDEVSSEGDPDELEDLDSHPF